MAKFDYVGMGYGGKVTNFNDKQSSVNYYVGYFLDRTQQMFEWKGLPDTIPQRDLELMIQRNGSCCITKVNGELYAFIGGYGGEPNPYYMPTIYTVANPALKFNKNLKINEECIIIPNDSLYIGLLPLMSRYASMMAENDISMRLMDVNARLTTIISASDDLTLKSAKQYIEDIEKGKMGIVAESAFLNGIKTSPCSSSSSVNGLTDLIEFQQYLKASLYNELGLNSNYNMKREAINGNEAELDNDALTPLPQDMLKQREVAVEKINAMFGTSISVELAGAWKAREEETLMQDEEVQEDGNSETEEGVSNVE